MEPLRFEIVPTPEETQRACSAITRAVLPPARGTLILYGVYAAIGAAAWFLTPRTIVPTFAIGVVAVTATVLLLQAEGRSRVRRLRTDDPHARERHVIEMDASGLRASCSHIDARYPWTDFLKVVEDNEFYLFVRPSGAGSAVPKRLLDDATDAALRARIRAWSPDAGSGLAREAA